MLDLNNTQTIVSALSLSISPVILISAIGLILLSLTNRFGRIIDRSRQVIAASSNLDKEDMLSTQHLKIFLYRAGILRWAILFACLSILLAASLVIVLFINSLLAISLGLLIYLLFILCMICLLLSIVFFIREIHISLNSLHMETHKIITNK